VSSTMPPTGPPTGGAEYLEHGGGAPLGPGQPRSRNLRPVLMGGAVVAALAVAGGAAWAAMSFLSTGAQPAEALPASTLGYVSIDLDPDGAQKIEAVRTLNKFPAFKAELGLDTDDDLRRAIFDEIQKDENCANLDYEGDIEPWLGNRAAFAAIDLGEDTPAVAVVVQVTDSDAATDGLTQLTNCADTGDADVQSSEKSQTGGFAVSGDWAVIAETDEIAQRLSGAAAEDTLADDEDFQTWTERAGDPGIVSMYAAAEAASVFFDSVDGLLPMAGLDPAREGSSQDPTEQMEKAFEGFEGMAATLRFDDGAIEFETAGGFGLQNTSFYATDRGDDVMSTLPADTAAAFGMGFEDGWLTQLAEQLSAAAGEDMTVEEMFAELSAQTGLDLPVDAETLLGESAVVAVGSDFDAEQLMSSADGSDVPVGIKVKGDPGAIEAVLDKVRGQMGPEEATFLEADAGDDMIAIGPNADYRGELLAGGTLGESDTFRDVIREAEQAGVIFYLDFDAGDDWLTTLAGDDPEAADNLAPLSAVGVSAWSEDNIAHGVLRVTTD